MVHHAPRRLLWAISSARCRPKLLLRSTLCGVTRAPPSSTLRGSSSWWRAASKGGVSIGFPVDYLRRHIPGDLIASDPLPLGGGQQVRVVVSKGFDVDYLRHYIPGD